MSNRCALATAVLLALACGGGDPVEEALVTEGIDARDYEPDGQGGWFWVGVRGGDRFCRGRLVTGWGVGPLRTADTFSEEQCDPVGGAVDLRWTCENREDGQACRDAGVAYQQSQDPAALPMFERACSLGEGAGCRLAGLAHRRGGLGTDPNPTAAADWFERGCNLSDDKSCLNRGRALGTDLDPLGCGEDVRAWYRRGGPESKAAWAEVEAECEGGDHRKARALWKESCDGGFFEGCRAWGYAMIEGIGGPPSPKEGVAVFERGCRGEPVDLQACIDFGVYLVETGDPSGGPRALSAFQKACDAGTAVGCRNAGIMLREGQLGVFPDGAGAKIAFQKGCNGGDAPSCKQPGVVRP